MYKLAEKLINGRIQHKHDVEANWLKAINFSPKEGELIIYDVDSTHNYPRIKIGDGETNVNALPFTQSLAIADSKLDANSTNPVQNSVIKTTIDELNSKLDRVVIGPDIESGGSEGGEGETVVITDNVAIFSDNTGKVLKDSGYTVQEIINQNAFSEVKVAEKTQEGDITHVDNVAAEYVTDSLVLAAGANITLTPDKENKAIIIEAKTYDTEIDEINTKLADLLYEAITISSFTNNVGTVEIGSTVNSVTLTWATSKTPESLTLDGTAIEKTLTTHTYSGLNLTSKKTYKIVATDERGASAEKTTSVSFVNGVYYGVISNSATVDNAAILGLTRKLQSSKSITFTVNPGTGEYIVFALPADYGTPNFNVGGFDGGFFLKTTFDLTNASGHTESYNVYFSDQVALGSSTVKVS